MSQSNAKQKVQDANICASGTRRGIVTGFALLFGSAFLVAAGGLHAASPSTSVPTLSAQQITERNIAARGGMAAWNAVQSMAWTGTMDAGVGDSPARSLRYARLSQAPIKKADALAISKSGEQPAVEEKQVQLPFVLEMKRPGMSRLELEFNGKTAVQVFDGKAGWKLRPFLNRDDWEPFTADELKASAGKWDLNGPLLDAAARGTKVETEGVEAVEGQPAYRLKLTLTSGEVQHIWVDAKTFLDVRVEGTSRRMDGRMHRVYITQRDFRKVQGILVPHVLETTVEGYPDAHKMQIQKISLNPILADDLFTKPRKPGGA